MTTSLILSDIDAHSYDSAVFDMNDCLYVQADVLRADGDHDLADNILKFLSQADLSVVSIQAR